MKSKMINSVRIEGILYEHKLEMKMSGPNSKKPGTEYIAGTVSVATDNNLINIVQVHYTYITATTSAGKEDSRFKTLKAIIDGEYGCYTDPAVRDHAAKVRIDTAIALNEFYTDRNGAEELVSAKRLEGGFIHITPSINENEKQRSVFETDILIVGTAEKDAVEDDNGNIVYPAKLILDGRIFSFRKDMLPVKFSVVNEKAMDYFRSLEPSTKNPIFTKVKGQVISQQGVRLIKEESAFGEDSVREIPTSNKDFIVTWAAVEPYDFGSEEVLTFDDLKEMAAARENTLATLKKRSDEYKATKANAGSAFNGTTAAPKKAIVQTVPVDDNFKF